MIGNIIAKVRKDKGMTKTELSRLAKIDIGHLTHIEKEERNPSHKTLKSICNALEIPYQQLMYTYDKYLSDDQENYGFINHISYNKLPAVSNIDSFIECPVYAASASLAVKITDKSMSPTMNINDYVFVEFNPLLSNGDIGLFELDGQILIRRFFSKKGIISLKPDNKNFPNIIVNDEVCFFIIGKIIVN